MVVSRVSGTFFSRSSHATSNRLDVLIRFVGKVENAGERADPL